MMKEEFEARVGFTVTPDYYRDAERQYMELPDALNIQKNEFCRIWSFACDDNKSIALYLLEEQTRKNREAISKLKNEIKRKDELSMFIGKELDNAYKRIHELEKLILK